MIAKAPNCSRYTDTVSTLVQMDVKVPETERCNVTLSSFSCQDKAFEKPDADTESYMTSIASDHLRKLGCDPKKMEVSFSTNLVGARNMEYSPEALAEGGLASNCFVSGNDINQANHKVTARCKPMFDMKRNEDGLTVRNFDMVFNADLATCDVSESAMPQLMEDARKVAMHNAYRNGYEIEKPEHLACTFSVLPYV